MSCRFAAVALVAITFAAAPAWAQLAVTADRPDGVYAVGDTVTWRITTAGAPALGEVEVTLRRGGLTEVGPLTLDAGDDAIVVAARFDTPGALLLVAAAGGGADGKPIKAVGGAIASPGEVALSAEPPADFDAFWEEKIAELQSVPVNAQFEEADSGRADVTYHKITMDNIRGTHIRGQLARPNEGGKFPAMLVVQWAGVYPLDRRWITTHAGNGWLTLNILAHDLPIDEPKAFYEDQSAGPLKGYSAIGNDDRDTSYFLRMYLSCFRAVEYLASRPDWDGRTIVVQGTSQGGMQALVTAGLNPKVTAAMANVPAGCDMLGQDVGRMPGWPQWVYHHAKGEKAEHVRDAARYYDVANFTPRINCPILVGVGLLDVACPPEGILAAMNQCDAPSEVVFLPRGEHQDKDGSHQPYYDRSTAWLAALRAGNEPPVQQWIPAEAAR